MSKPENIFYSKTALGKWPANRHVETIIGHHVREITLLVEESGCLLANGKMVTEVVTDGERRALLTTWVPNE